MSRAGVPSGVLPLPDLRVQRLVWSALAATLVAVVALGLWTLHVRGGRASELPVYGRVPAFALVERTGRPIGADDLAGHVWIASFVFTRCAGMCPALATTTAALMRRLAESGRRDVRAVTFTVDPAHDDPAALRAYAERFGADERWLFVTGDHDAMTRLVRDGFHLSIAELPPEEREHSREPITHSDRFVLVDPGLRIRGYYHGTDPDAVVQLEHDLALLAGSRT